MGYGAYVCCDCYKKGKTIEPPYKKYVIYGECGLKLEIPQREKAKLKGKYRDILRDFGSWKYTACEHEDMHLLDFIELTGLRGLKSLVDYLEGERFFPTLTKFFPKQNDGIVPVHEVQNFINELICLSQLYYRDERPSILEKRTNSRIYSTMEENYDFLTYSFPYDYVAGINKYGFFIAEDNHEVLNEIKDILFTSNHFTQTKLEDNFFEFRDLKSNQTFRAQYMNIYRNTNYQGNSFEFEVIRDWQLIGTETEYGYTIKTLMKLCKASLKTNNPIHWT